MSKVGQKETDIETYGEDIYYSPRYYDDSFEYRHVNVPKQIGILILKLKLAGCRKEF